MFEQLRARWQCWRRGHVPIITRRFGSPGVDWVCYRCLRNLGTTTTHDAPRPTSGRALERTDRHVVN